MNILILSQKISDLHMDIIQDALSDHAKITLITGSQLEKHVYVKAPKHDPESLISRLKCWFSYYYFVMSWIKDSRDKKYDLVFATSNPPINGYLGVKLKKKLSCKFVYMNWDLYPEVIETSMKGVVPKIVAIIWHRINNKIYPEIDQMVTIGKVMGETINESLKNPIDIKIIPMFTDVNRLHPISKKDNLFCAEHCLTDKFVVLYSGKMGLGHNIELLLEASKYTKTYTDICYLLIGHGQKYRYIENWIEENQSENVKILPLQPEAVFPMSMASGDIGFISQEKGAAKCFMPAKTYDMMACGMPLITFSEGTDDLSLLVKDNDLGITMTNNDPRELAKHIVYLYKDKEMYKYYSQNCRQLAINRFDIKPVVESYRQVFKRVISRG